jgi:hypothetical protein
MLLFLLPGNSISGPSDNQEENNQSSSTSDSTSTRSSGGLILIGPNQTQFGRFGELISYNVTITNNQTIIDYIDITTSSGPSDWAVTLFYSDGITILKDSAEDNDGIPDTGLMAPLDTFEFVVKVTVPVTQAFNEPEVTIVTALSSLSSDPVPINCKLVTKAYPNLDLTKSVDPVTIYEKAAGVHGFNTRARVTLNVKGGGTPIISERFHDVVFLIDNTGSMATNDPFNFRHRAANGYVDNMTFPDQGSVVTFHGSSAFPQGYAWLARGPPSSSEEHLSTNYARLKDNINWTGWPANIGGRTNILRAIQVGNNELINYGNPDHVWFSILLTDGYDSGNFVPGDRDNAIRNAAQTAANNGIIIFTIGLGSTTNVLLLQDIATTTGGQYYAAANAEDLMDIYKQIQYNVNDIAGKDPNPNDDESMVSDVLPDYIEYVQGSFRIEPGSIATDPNPSKIVNYPTNSTFHWDVNEILINQSWLVSYEITSTKVGWVPVSIYPDSHITYSDWTGIPKYKLAFPEVWIEVLPTPWPDVLPSNVSVNGVPYKGTEDIQVLRGDTLTISSAIINDGTAQTWIYANEFHIGFFDTTVTGPQSPFYASLVKDLDIKEVSNVFEIAWEAPQTLGRYKISIIADYQELLPEGEFGEFNNVVNLTFNVTFTPVTDLIPVSLKIDHKLIQDPASEIVEVEIGQQKSIQIQVENFGNVNTNYYALEFFVSLYNKSDPENIIGTGTLDSVNANTRSAILEFNWLAPDEMQTVELEIEVDSTNIIPEGDYGELNNKISFTMNVIKNLFIDLKPELLKINDESKDLTGVIDGNYRYSYDLVIGQLAVIEFQIYSDANERSSYFNPDFLMIMYNHSDTGGGFFYRENVKEIQPESISPIYNAKWRAPLQEGQYIIGIRIDHFDVIEEYGDGEKNNFIRISMNVFDLIEPPEPELEINEFRNDALITWDSAEGAELYQIFGGPKPGELDLENPLAESDLNSWRHLGALFDYKEYYYCIIALDEHGWAGPTSSIIGFYTKQFQRGYNSFSLPLEPFYDHKVSWYVDNMLELDYETIFYYDEYQQKWLGHPKFYPSKIDNFEMKMGKSYTLLSGRDFDFTFTGRPEALLRFVSGIPDDEWLGGAVSDKLYRNGLKLSVRESGVMLEWYKPVDTGDGGSELEYFEVYRQTKRGAIKVSTSGSAANIESTLEQLTTTRLTRFIDSGANKYIKSNIGSSEGMINEPVDETSNLFGYTSEHRELHYLVIPVDELGRRGGSTYGRSISIMELRNGLNTYGITFIDTALSDVDNNIKEIGINDADTLYYFNNDHNRWIGHPRYLPYVRDNPEMKQGEGYLIFILTEYPRFVYRIT